MDISQVTPALESLFPAQTIEANNDENWQIQTEKVRLLVLLSADKSWLRILAPIASAAEAQPLLSQLMEANFDVTGAVRYALSQNVLWSVFQHSFASLTEEDFRDAIAQIVAIAEKGLSQAFQQLVEVRIKQIIQAAKAQGKSKEATYQTLERFYQEGMLGDMDRAPEERNSFLAAWKMQLDRLWEEESS